jgi:arabinan endo-1,5-alpha-L-arabinosidase
MGSVSRIFAAVVISISTTSSFAAGCPENPVLDQNFADPEILAASDGYLAYATNGAGRKVQIAFSPDLAHWTIRKDALPRLPRWAVIGWTWAPQVIGVGGSYVMYFTARSRNTGDQCIGTATSTAPEGPFKAASDAPLVCQGAEGGSIDPAAFHDGDGSLHLVWKSDGNSRKLDTFIYLQALSPDGLTLIGPLKRLIRQDLSWEGDLVEAPTLWKHEGRYFLFYSANAYSDARYAIGYAVADRIDGPYRKSPAPLLASIRVGGVDYVGPGGQTIVTDRTGQDWIGFHSWSADHSRRAMNIAPLDWKGGKPVVRLGCRH